MARPTKYKKKYAKELLNGLRREPDIRPSGKEYGWSISRICEKWGITEKTYHNWRAEFKSFDEACEVGERDFMLFLEEQYDDALWNKNANGGLMKFKMANVAGWTDKKEVKQEGPAKIGTVNIQMLDSPKVPQLDNSNIIDITDESEKRRHKTDEKSD